MKTDEQLANEIINARDGRDHPAGFVRAGKVEALKDVSDFAAKVEGGEGDGYIIREYITAKIAELEGRDEE